MLVGKLLEFDNLRITMYDFEFAGDLLPSHRHVNDDQHITVCVRGEVEIETPEWIKTLKEGNIIRFQKNQWHSIKALTDNARVLNIPTVNV